MLKAITRDNYLFQHTNIDFIHKMYSFDSFFRFRIKISAGYLKPSFNLSTKFFFREKVNFVVTKMHSPSIRPEEVSR